ncbi:hypothetical protein MLD38_001284 [Melastoma candidum]|uniref:Uncharacterized protein n=1 Tax=Melastoma candidum TaxID=119954 RepID=A0ACB9SDQ9_9MYRT|nr:hypothetical protein MLD38_001284 [Melastoma candidum]
MGNLCTCFSTNPGTVKKKLTVASAAASSRRITNRSTSNPSLRQFGSSHQFVGGVGRVRSSSRKDDRSDYSADAITLSGDVSFDRSASLRYPLPRKQGLPRSSSTRPRSVGDPLLHPHQLVRQDLKIDELETNHFVLVHGGGFGAWCWYKSIALLEEVGYTVTAIDLTGSGVHSSDTNRISSLKQYAKPLIDFLDKLDDGEKVILVGHDFGGACISYAMELLPGRISKAIFVSATMLGNGESPLDVFSKQAGSNPLIRQAQILLYGNGNDHPPTAIDLDKSILKDLLFNKTPAKDIALASVSMRSIPFAPVLEKLSLTEEKYGSVRRFYVQTTEDNAIPLAEQEEMVNLNPPERSFCLRGADHSPFFSKPQGLHKVLVEISGIPVKHVSAESSLDRTTPIQAPSAA